MILFIAACACVIVYCMLYLVNSIGKKRVKASIGISILLFALILVGVLYLM